MKTYCIAVCIIGTILSANKLNAATYSPDGTDNCSAYTTVSLSRPCQPADPEGHLCIIIGDNLTEIKSCTSCPSGYTLKTKTIADCCIEYKYGACIGNCSSTCGNNTTEWSTVKAGYETRVYEYCSGSTTCTKKTQYRCAAGYYGSSSNGTSGCTSCPSRLSGATTTPISNPGTGAFFTKSFITDCYFPAYKDIRDIYGIYQYTETCYYKNDPLIIN